MKFLLAVLAVVLVFGSIIADTTVANGSPAATANARNAAFLPISPLQ